MTCDCADWVDDELDDDAAHIFLAEAIRILRILVDRKNPGENMLRDARRLLDRYGSECQ